jgi:hypothetical protein
MKFVIGIVLLVLICVVPTVVLAGLVEFCRFIYRKAGLIPAAVLGLAIVASPVVAWEWFKYRHALSHVPTGLHISSITFEAEDVFGFGPGGAEEGLLLYELPEAIAHRIEAEGVGFLESLHSDPWNRNWNEEYVDWQLTPSGGRGLPLGPALCEYPDCSAIPAPVRDRVNAIIATPGSYLARQRGSKIIIVSPREQLVVIRYGK